MDRKYLSCAETAKLVRAALKESFPGVKFSVRSDVYSGGASIRVRYQDGPAFALVEPVVKVFEGAYFDGMIDYKGSRYHKLDGQPVSFGANFVFLERDHSDALVRRAVEETAAKYGIELKTDAVELYRKGGLWSVGELLDRKARELLYKLSDRLAAMPSATLKRIGFAGDDGYGHGTVGRDPANPNGGQAYRAMEEQRERVRVLPELAGLEPQGRA